MSGYKIVINLQMETKDKNRIMSQQYKNISRKGQQQATNVTNTLRKIASLRNDKSSPLRATQTLGRAAHSKYIQASQTRELHNVAVSKHLTSDEGKTSGLQKKKSEHNMRNAAQNLSKYELSNYESSLHVLADVEHSQNTRFERSKKAKQPQRIYFTKGNNHQLLKQLFVDKYEFTQAFARQGANICWLQSSNQKEIPRSFAKSPYQEHLPEIRRRKGQSKIIYNYLEGQSELTNKQKLYKNMAKSYPQAISNYIPKSFIIDFKLDVPQVQQSLLQFMAYYFKKDKNRRPRNKSIVIKNYFAQITVSHKQLNKLIQKSEINNEEIKDDKNQEQKTEPNQSLWILKPTYLNRGRGIHLFATLKQLSKLLSETPFEISVKMYSQSVRPMTYIIQQYIDPPLLIDGFKFDMRFWVLLQVVKVGGIKVLKASLFKQGYIRLASVKYKSQDQKQGQNHQQSKEQKQNVKKEKKAYINNKFIHLTNNAVQKDAKQYGQFCEGNQLSLENMIKYFREKNEECPLTLDLLLDNIVKVVGQSVNCVKNQLIESNHSKTFQLLGYDFLLDQNYKLWLIEANCNPCLEQSSALLGSLLRQMLSGLIHLTNLSEGKGPGQSTGWIQLP